MQKKGGGAVIRLPQGDILRPHSGYPLVSCSPAELTSVSPEPYEKMGYPIFQAIDLYMSATVPVVRET